MPGVKTSAKRRSFCSRRQRCSQGRSGGAHGPPTAPTMPPPPRRPAAAQRQSHSLASGPRSSPVPAGAVSAAREPPKGTYDLSCFMTARAGFEIMEKHA